MKKYKLQCDDLLKSEIYRAHGMYSDFNLNGKLFVSSLALYLILELSNYDNKLTNSLGFLSAGIIGLSGMSIAKNQYTVNSSLYKLKKLELSLLEKNIYVDFDNAKVISDCKLNVNDELIEMPLCIIDEDAAFSINCNKDSIIYRDDESNYDITDNVMKSLLNKKEYKRYLKNKNNEV